MFRPVRDRILSRFRTDPVADDGRSPSGQSSRNRRFSCDGRQLVVHLPRDQIIPLLDRGARHPRRILALRRHVRAGDRLRVAVGARDAGQKSRGHREESHRTPRPTHEQHSKPQAYALRCLSLSHLFHLHHSLRFKSARVLRISVIFFHRHLEQMFNNDYKMRSMRCLPPFKLRIYLLHCVQ